jgi:CheY-like chemotaxis protein
MDDNETNRKIVYEQVIAWGLKNGMALDGQSALEMLRHASRLGEPYDLAILDMQKPQMGGIELARKIRAEPLVSSTKLVMLSSIGQRGESEEARQAGMDAYLTKPVRQSQLYDAIATVLGTTVEEEALEKSKQDHQLQPKRGKSPLSAPNPGRRGQRRKPEGDRKDAGETRLLGGRRG